MSDTDDRIKALARKLGLPENVNPSVEQLHEAGIMLTRPAPPKAPPPRSQVDDPLYIKSLMDVVKERAEQINEHNRTPRRDEIENRGFELASAAVAYIMPPISNQNRYLFWPWEVASFKPATGGSPLENYRKNLVKGLALGLAELERLDAILARRKP